MTIAILAILAAIAFSTYSHNQYNVQVATACRDVGEISQRINRYQTLNNSIPPDLATIGMDQLVDPWGNPYVYLPFTDVNGKGKMRKDKNLNPINTEYDLYSVGLDGKSVSALTAKASQDDVIYAGDGSYIGLASNF